jgi:hypothetical protein
VRERSTRVREVLSWKNGNSWIRVREDEAKTARGKAKLARTFALKNQVFTRAKQSWGEAKSGANGPASETYKREFEALLKGSTFGEKNWVLGDFVLRSIFLKKFHEEVGFDWKIEARNHDL